MFFFINEANLDIKHEVMLIKIEGYNLEVDKMYKHFNNARSIMYVRKKLSYERIKKYENENDSSIVIRIGLPNKKKFYIYGIYRQWSLPNDKESKSISKQEERWKLSINQMSKVLDLDKEVLIIGDINLNTLSFKKSYEEKSAYERSL